MRLEDAVYGGEMSAHHYFRDFAYCDSGMIPWLLVAEMLSTTGQPLSSLVGKRMAAYPCSGEINFQVQDTQTSINVIHQHFLKHAPQLTDMTDGLSMEFAEWRFNLRGSNTEPMLRLNVEGRGSIALVAEKTQLIKSLLQ